MQPKYLDITVQLSGQDGNAFHIIGRCRRAMREADIEAAEIKAFQEEAMNSGYDHLLQTCMRWFDCG